ncbi:MAG: IPT/TIG domain-containing protein [Acidobacteria bacterium]|nr:IPT/TIG domain-containing protein [Acidobacteriota bacterium]
MRRYLYSAIVFTLLCPNSSRAQITTPAIASGGILNAASLAAETGNTAAPGSLISIFGRNLAASAASANAVPLPLNLGGTVVQIGNTFAPLLFVSPTQINAQVPLEVLPNNSVPVTVFVNGRASAPAALQVKVTAPGIFTTAGTGVGAAQAIHPDGTLVTADSPAPPGEEISITVTGLGLTITSSTSSPLATGQAGNGQTVLNVPSVTIGGTAATVTSASAAPGQVGQYVIKAIVPSIFSGDQPMVVSAAGSSSQATVTVRVGQPPPPGSIGGGGFGGGQPPAISVGGVVNATSLVAAPNNTVAPGALISIFGNNLAATTAAASETPLPRDISGTSVLIGDRSAPLLLVSPTQINAQVPFETPVGVPVNVVVVVNGSASQAEPVLVDAASPAVIALSGKGTGAARVLHADLSPVSNDSPSVAGEEVLIVATGLGATLASGSLPALAAGETGAGQPAVVSPAVTIGGKPARVFSAMAIGGVGQYQVRVTVPDIPAGDQPVVITVGDKTSQPGATLRVGFPAAVRTTFSQMRIDGTLNVVYKIDSITALQPDPADPTKTKELPVIFSYQVPCRIDIAGTTGPTYSALFNCQNYTNPLDIIGIVAWMKSGNYANNLLQFSQLDDHPGVDNHFYLESRVTPFLKFVTAQSVISSAAQSINFTDLSQGTPVIGTFQITLKLENAIIGGVITGTITSVQ